MNSIKQHFFFILPLMALLFSLESLLIINRAIISKEDVLLQNYSIIIASKNKITIELLSQNIPEVASLTPIDPSFIFEKIRLKTEEIENLKKELPIYYTIKLASFPDEKRLNEINKRLNKIPGIIKSESFSKTHNQASHLLFLVKLSIQVFSLLIGILSALLMIGQIRVWHFEHNKRIKIMGFLGASGWMKNKFLIQAALSDSIIASFIVIIGFLYVSTTPFSAQIIQTLGIQNDVLYVVSDFALLLVSALAISLASVIVAIMLQRNV